MGETEYKARVTLDTVMKIETLMEKSVIAVAQMAQGAELTTMQMAQILTPVIRAGGNDVTPKDVAKVIFNSGIAEAYSALGELFSIALNPQGQEEEVGNGEESD